MLEREWKNALFLEKIFINFMKNKNIKISFDKDAQVLSLRLGRFRSSDSDIQNNVVIDYDKNGKIVGIDIHDFSFEDFRENKEKLQGFMRNNKVSVLVK